MQQNQDEHRRALPPAPKRLPYGDDATSSDVGLDLDHLYGDALRRTARAQVQAAGGSRARSGRPQAVADAADDGDGRRQRPEGPGAQAARVDRARARRLTPPPSPPSSPLSRSSGNTSDGELSRSCSRLCLDGGRRTSAADLYALDGRTSLDGRRPSEGRLSSRYSVLGLDGSHRRRHEPSRYDADPYALACDLETVPWLSSGVGPIRARRAVRFAFGTKAPGPRPSGARRLSDDERARAHRVAAGPRCERRRLGQAPRRIYGPRGRPLLRRRSSSRRCGAARPQSARSLSSLSEDDNK